MANTYYLLLLNIRMGFSDCRCYFLSYRDMPWDLSMVLRSKTHLSFVRSLPCCVCLKTFTVQAAHIRKGVSNEHKGGMGMKPSDRMTVPLCYECHNNEQHRVGEQTFWTDMSFPIGLAENLYLLTGNREKSIHEVIRFNRIFSKVKK